MSSITVEQYSEKAIVVRGNSIPYKEKLLSIGGKWNKMLKGGEGWIFPLTKKPIVEKLLSEPPTESEIDSSDNVQKIKTTTLKPVERISEVVLTKKEYLHLISRIEILEQLVSKFSDNEILPKEKKINKKLKIPPPLSSISDSDLSESIDYENNLNCDSDNEREPVQRLLRRKN